MSCLLSINKRNFATDTAPLDPVYEAEIDAMMTLPGTERYYADVLRLEKKCGSSVSPRPETFDVFGAKFANCQLAQPKSTCAPSWRTP